LLTAFAIGVCSAAGLTWAQGSDELWEVTTNVDMPGMPMAIPAQTMQVCKDKNRRVEDDIVKKDQPCKMTDMRTSGTRTTYSIVCEGKDAFSGTGEHEMLGKDSYRMKMHMNYSSRGMSMDMVTNARRIGACDAKGERRKLDERVDQIKRDANAQTESVCRGMVDKYMWQVVLDGQKNASCTSYKGEMCGKIGALAENMNTYEGYSQMKSNKSPLGGAWRDAFRACALAEPPMPSCSIAVDARKLGFVARFCPAEVQSLGRQHCGGRDYTAIFSSQWAPICRKYLGRSGAESDDAPGSDYNAPSSSRTESSTPAQPQQPKPEDVLKGGADVLKKLFKF
jgi:hypothetical protein